VSLGSAGLPIGGAADECGVVPDLGCTGTLLGVYRSTGGQSSTPVDPQNRAGRHPPRSADRGPLVAALCPSGPIEDRQLPNTFSTRTTVTLRFSALLCVCCRIRLYGIKAASGGAHIVGTVV